jgi:hypothetical protein
MAQQITRLLPNRSYAEADVINSYALDANSGEAGTFVKVSSANLSDDPVVYGNFGPFANTLGNATSQYPYATQRVVATSGTGDAGQVVGMILRDVRQFDENGENLLYYPAKKFDLQCVLSGEANPILARGVVEINARGLAGGVCPGVGHAAVLAANGRVTGVAYSSLTTEQRNAVVGTFIGTGLRESQQNTDFAAGAYARLKFSV